MATTLFPIIGDVSTTATETALPMYREVACDEGGLPIWKNGNPVIVQGKEAVRLWVMTALRTNRYFHGIYTNQFGCELTSLIGKGFSDDVKTSEAPRMVREALLVNPYITSVSDIEVAFSDTTLTITATVNTIYGEVSITYDS